MLVMPGLGRQRQIDTGDHCPNPNLASLMSIGPVRDPVLTSKVASLMRNGS